MRILFSSDDGIEGEKRWLSEQKTSEDNNLEKVFITEKFMSLSKKLCGEMILTGRHWTQEEIDYLKENYQKMTYKEIAKKLVRGENEVGLKASKLSLKKSKKYNMTEKYDLKTREGRRLYHRDVRRINKDEINAARRLKYRTDEKYREKKKSWSLESLHRIYRKHKMELFRLRGNKCEVCGETEEVCLVTHHIDAKLSLGKKEYDKLGQRKYLLLKEELVNLALLCENCHRKVHAGLVKLKEREV